MAGAIGGRTAGGEALAYHHYRAAYTPRHGCPPTVAADVMSHLHTMRNDTGHALRAITQRSNTPIDEVPRENRMKYASVASKETALRVVSSAARTPLVSRITLTIDGRRTDDVLVALAGVAVKSPCINDFKLMVPEAIGSGPDDFVVYFNQPLSSAEVAAVIGTIQEKVGPFLVDGSPPLGKEKLAAGIFGSEMPPATVTGTKLNFNGSHGDDRGKIAALAVKRRAESGGDLAAELRLVLQEVGLDPGNPARRLLAPPSSPSQTVQSPLPSSKPPSTSSAPPGAGGGVPG